MITKEKLKIYIKYRGDIDRFARTGRKAEEDTITTNEWYLIDELVQDLKLLESGMTSETFVKEVTTKLNKNCEDQDVIKLMETIKY